MSTHPPHMKNSPSAFIPFCEYNGDMMAIGEYIDNFPFPVCNAFKPSILDGQLCYEFDPATIQANITSNNPYIFFILDYNEDRQYHTHQAMEREKGKKRMRFSEMVATNHKENEALIYIHTLGKGGISILNWKDLAHQGHVVFIG